MNSYYKPSLDDMIRKANKVLEDKKVRVPKYRKRGPKPKSKDYANELD